MGKLNSIIRFEGTFNGMTNVNSKGYTPHTRRARGTVTVVGVNEAYQRSGGHLIKANYPAKLIKASLDKYRGRFVGGQLWQELVSAFKLQVRDGVEINTAGLAGVEANGLYPLTRFFYGLPKFTHTVQEGLLHVRLGLIQHPHFTRKTTDGYRLSLITVFPDFAADTATDHLSEAPIRNLADPCTEMIFSIPLEGTEESFLACLKLESSSKGELVNDIHASGMAVLGGGEL